MYTVIILYSVYCILYSIHKTLYSTLYSNVYTTLYSIQSAIHTMLLIFLSSILLYHPPEHSQTNLTLERVTRGNTTSCTMNAKPCKEAKGKTNTI